MWLVEGLWDVVKPLLPFPLSPALLNETHKEAKKRKRCSLSFHSKLIFSFRLHRTSSLVLPLTLIFFSSKFSYSQGLSYCATSWITQRAGCECHSLHMKSDRLLAREERAKYMPGGNLPGLLIFVRNQTLITALRRLIRKSWRLIASELLSVILFKPSTIVTNSWCPRMRN